MSMQSNIIPSGRPRTGHRVGTAVIAASAGLGILALLGMNPIVLALAALGVLGSLLIATDARSSTSRLRCWCSAYPAKHALD